MTKRKPGRARQKAPQAEPKRKQQLNLLLDITLIAELESIVAKRRVAALQQGERRPSLSAVLEQLIRAGIAAESPKG